MFKKAIWLIFLCLIMLPAWAGDKKNELRFLTLSDIHFDPFITCRNQQPCPLIEKLRKANSSEWPGLLAKYENEPLYYRQDTNYTLLVSSLSAAKEVAAKNDVQFILFLGDYLGHNYREFYKKYSTDQSREGYQAFVRKTFEFLNHELAEAFPATDIYMVVGNNDSYQNNYVTTPGGPFLQEMAVLWSSLIKSPNNRSMMRQTFPSGGYYAIDAPSQSNLRLIILNTNLFSTRGRGRNLNAAAMQELNWLKQQLALAKSRKQKVLIAMHIPMGVDIYSSLRVKLFRLVELWKSQYTERFQTELKTYAPEIDGILTGHLHSDSFQIAQLGDGMEVPISITPSISPIYGNNPGFKVYIYSLESEQLINFVTYYYPLDTRQAWGMEYNFTEVYQPNCHSCPIRAGMDLLRSSGNLANYYRLFYSASSTSQPIMTKWYPYYWCAIHNIDPNEYKRCISQERE